MRKGRKVNGEEVHACYKELAKGYEKLLQRLINKGYPENYIKSNVCDYAAIGGMIGCKFGVLFAVIGIIATCCVLALNSVVGLVLAAGAGAFAASIALEAIIGAVIGLCHVIASNIKEDFKGKARMYDDCKKTLVKNMKKCEMLAKPNSNCNWQGYKEDVKQFGILSTTVEFYEQGKVCDIKDCDKTFSKVNLSEQSPQIK